VAQPGPARRALGPALIGVGGVLTVVGSTVTWVHYSFAQPELALLSQSRPGLAEAAGRVTIACGVLALAAIPLMLVVDARWRRLVAAAAVVLGMASVVVASVNLATKDAQVYDAIRSAIAQTTGHPLTDAEFALLKTQLLATGFSVSIGAGIYVVVAGGLLTMAGGLADMADGQERAPEDPFDGDEEVPTMIPTPEELASPPDAPASQNGPPGAPI
jgi:Tryptophan-associated transmembrane protein (Trp_oprn_chp)